jgi:hypothetical protein
VRAAIVFGVALASVACGEAKGHQGEACNPPTGDSINAASTCDDGLVCIGPSADATCGPCSPVDPAALCDLLHVCANGACVACAAGPDHCGDGSYGRSCTDAGTCAASLVCSSGDLCFPADAGMKAVQADD